MMFSNAVCPTCLEGNARKTHAHITTQSHNAVGDDCVSPHRLNPIAFEYRCLRCDRRFTVPFWRKCIECGWTSQEHITGPFDRVTLEEYVGWLSTDYGLTDLKKTG